MEKKLIIFLSIIVGQLFGQDIRGAYIRTKWISGFSNSLTYSITLTLFTDATMNIPRPTVPISFGDSSSGTLSLTTSLVTGGLNVKTYSGIHTYGGGTPPGASYIVEYLDTFRVAGIKNIPNSQTQQIYVEARIYANNLYYSNSSSIISNLTFSLGVSGNQVSFNPVCSDPDGDSLSFKQKDCYASSYYLPGNAAFNYSTGVVSFSKDSIGLYAFSFRVLEWRNDLSGVPGAAGSTQIDFIMDITSILGLNEVNSEDLFKVYPNPVNDKFVIKGNIHSDLQLIIINSLGQTIYNSYNVKFLEEIDVSNLQSGIYYVKARNAEGQKVYKIIKE